MLFKRENNLGKSKPIQKKDQDLPHIDVPGNRGISGNAKELISEKTLDELGIPPPPPSSSSKQQKNKKVVLRPLNTNTHETSQPSLPSDYAERLKAFNFKADPEILEEMKNHRKQRVKPVGFEQNIIKKTILKDVSQKTITKVDSIEKKFKDLQSKHKEFEKSVKETMKTTNQEMKELLKENNHILGENSAIVEENKLLVSEMIKLTKKNEALLTAQEKNAAFVESFKAQLQPQVEQEKALILQNRSIAKEALVIHNQFKQLKLLFEQQSNVSKNHAGHISKLQQTVNDIIKIVHELKQEHLPERLEKVIATANKRDTALLEKIDEAHSLAKKTADESSKNRNRLEILRERFNAYKKHKK